MKIKTEALREAFRICDAIPINAVIESSAVIRIRQDRNKLFLTLTGAMGCEMCLTGVSQGGKWTSYINRETLKRFLATAASSEVELFHKDKLILKSGQRLELPLPDTITGYTTQTLKKGSAYNENLIKFLRTASRYISTQSGTESFQAVSFGKEAIFVTDSVSIMALTGSPTTEYLLPPEIIGIITMTNAEVSIEKTGIGVTLSNGTAFQPLSDELKNFPRDKCLEWIKEGSRAATIFTFVCSDFLDHLKAVSLFLNDKTEPVTIEENKGSLTLTVQTLATGIFQRTFKLLKPSGKSVKYTINAEKILPWMLYIAENDPSTVITFARLKNGCVFKYAENTLLTVDF
jgi:hypothetical protein